MKIDMLYFGSRDAHWDGVVGAIKASHRPNVSVYRVANVGQARHSGLLEGAILLLVSPALSSSLLLQLTDWMRIAGLRTPLYLLGRNQDELDCLADLGVVGAIDREHMTPAGIDVLIDDALETIFSQLSDSDEPEPDVKENQQEGAA